jgi:hypothetical protein
MCSDDVATVALIDEVIQNPTGVNNVNTPRPQGNSRQAALRSLRNNAPLIHKEVISGKLSAHATTQNDTEDRICRLVTLFRF